MTRVANGFCAPLANISERILDIDELITVQRWKGPSAFDPLTLRMAASIWLRLKKNGCTTGSVAAKKMNPLTNLISTCPGPNVVCHAADGFISLHIPALIP